MPHSLNSRIWMAYQKQMAPHAYQTNRVRRQLMLMRSLLDALPGHTSPGGEGSMSRRWTTAQGSGFLPDGFPYVFPASSGPLGALPAQIQSRWTGPLTCPSPVIDAVAPDHCGAEGRPPSHPAVSVYKPIHCPFMQGSVMGWSINNHRKYIHKNKIKVMKNSK